MKILNETAVLPEPGKRRRRNSDYILDIIIPENFLETLSDDEDCILSSTLFDEDPAAAENRSLAKDLAKVKTEIFRNSFNLEPGTSDFKQELAVIKAEFENSSRDIEEKLRIMAYQFPMHEAMQCIPDFYGDPEQLDAFLYQVNFSAGILSAKNLT